MRTFGRKMILSFAALAGAGIIGAVPARAGEINSDEARVISTASDTFYYDNKVYKADQSYINELRSRLAADNVNLTSEQADEAISRIYANIPEGISEGYLYEIEEDDATTDQYDEGTDNDNTDSTGANDNTVDENADGSSSKDNTDVIDKSDNQDSTTGNDSAQQANNQLDSTDGVTSSESSEEAKDSDDSAIEQKKEEAVIKELDKTIDDELADEEDSSVKIKYDEENQRMVLYQNGNSKQYNLPSVNSNGKINAISKAMMVILVINIIVLAVCFGILWIKKCFTWQRKRRGKENGLAKHKVRKKIRKVIRYVLMGVLILDFVCVLAGSSCALSLGRNQFVKDHLTSSSYNRYAYNQMMGNVNSIIEKLSDEDKEIIKANMGYDAFLKACNDIVDEHLKGNSAQFDEKSFKEKLQSKLGDVSDMTDTDKEEVVNDCAQQMTEYTKDVIGSSIYGIRQAVKESLRYTKYVLLICILISFAMLLFMQPEKIRGIHKFAKAIIAAGAVTAVLAVLCYILNPVKNIYIEPNYIVLFLTDYIKRGMLIVLTFGLVGIFTGIAIYEGSNYIKRKKDE